MKKLLTLALAVLCVLSLAACDSGSGNAGKDTLIYISNIKPETFDPLTAVNIEKASFHAIFDNLICFDENGGYQPMLAESYETSADGMTYTFKLRKDVKFHDGSSFTAEDFIYTMDSLMANPNYYYMADYFAAYEKLDDYTVTVSRPTPYANSLGLLADTISVVCKSAREADVDGFAMKPIGSGPYTFVGKGSDDSVTLKANPNYWGDKPAFENAIVKAPLDAATAVIALETGEADLAIWLPQAQASLVESNKDLTLVTEYDSFSTVCLALMGEPLKNDVNLRKAIFHGVNRESAISIGNEGVGTPPANMAAKRIMGEYDGIIEFVGFDEELARDYLSKSGYNGEEITLSLYADQKVAESVQADLKKLGINTKLEVLDINNYVNKIITGEINAALQQFGSAVLSLEDFMQTFGSSNAFYGANLAANQEYDDLLEAMKTEYDTAARTALVKRAQEIMVDMANLVPVFGLTYNYAHGPDIKYEYKISASTYLIYLAKVTRP